MRAGSSTSRARERGAETSLRCGAIVPSRDDVVILVDTSAWIAVLRRGGPRLEDQLDFDDVVTCLPIVQEVLQGIDEERPFRQARGALLSLPIVESPLSLTVIDDAVDLYRRARGAGVTVRSSVDCVVAACAIRHRLTVLHDDRDYPKLARVSTLEVRSLRAGRRSR
jgi:predicted nucleic acid-binding protein